MENTQLQGEIPATLFNLFQLQTVWIKRISQAIIIGAAHADIGTSATVQNEELEEMRRTIQQLSRNCADEREKRKHEEKIRDTLRNDIDSLKAQVNHLIGLPRSPPKSHIYEEDESDGNNTNYKEEEGEPEDE
ncbi:PREDICTED: uncharacterized protein LOC109243666 isoform X2 [Nicotiana attenuata]|uniref:uncharacterized protein LOC109243666 isoform X2 n=1 Tax=Nicotiana attenuata TaxID=49451 RepID=UPI0009051678|nr:PREDICTED: uncharacterized protein LOC109243666 isoform X2 [Nicotiana attenuata]